MSKTVSSTTSNPSIEGGGDGIVCTCDQFAEEAYCRYDEHGKNDACVQEVGLDCEGNAIHD